MRLDPDGYLIVCDTALGIYKVNVATGMLISAWCCYSDFYRAACNADAVL